MTNPTIEIIGTGTHNRGAELMAIAIMRHFRANNSAVRIAAPMRFGTFEERARHGLLTTVHVPGRRNLPMRLYLNLAPAVLRERLGVVKESEVTAVLDASGFKYSDQWSGANAGHMARLMSRPQRRKQPLILLPQALGPFDKPGSAESFRLLLDRSARVYARDPDSYQAASQLDESGKVRLCSDFTVSLPGRLPEGCILPDVFGAIVPNYRMIDRSPASSAQVYLQTLEQMALSLRSLSLEPVVVLHDAKSDAQLLKPLFARVGKLQVFESNDPLILKGILGRATVVVGSRYHALVSSLSQGVVTIGFGWSHKYKWLFQDFGCPECFVENSMDQSKLEGICRSMTDPAWRRDICEAIKEKAINIKKQVAAMWVDVDQLLGLRGEAGHQGTK